MIIGQATRLHDAQDLTEDIDGILEMGMLDDGMPHPLVSIEAKGTASRRGRMLEASLVMKATGSSTNRI
jgi:hypothetical protein